MVELADWLKHKNEFAISSQIKRSGTSISANIAEGNHPQSRADMISKFEIALKEASETENWLQILFKADQIDEKQFKSFEKQLIKIKILLIKSIKTLKRNSI